MISIFLKPQENVGYVALYGKNLRHGRGNRRRVSASYLPIYSQNVYLAFIFVYKSVLPPHQLNVTDPVVFVFSSRLHFLR